MAGHYTYLKENDYSREDGTTFLEGRTHGCGCCSESEALTRQDLVDHIESLYNEAEECSRLLKKYFGE